MTSSTHQVTVARDQKRLRWAVDLADGTAPADGDFILEWAPAVGREPRAVYFSEEVDGEQYSLLMMMPPDDGAAVADRLARETVFVIDTSGSMSGTALEQAKQALLQGIARLQPGDWFNVMRFSDKASALFHASVPATPATLETAREYIQALEVDGGTNDMAALEGTPSYFDFDAFEEMQVDTGGADVTLETAGARLTTQHPRGTNEGRGSVLAEGSEGGLLVGDEKEARLDSLRTLDAEAGGPILRDRLWVWGEAGRDEIGRLALGGQLEERRRTSGSLRVNAQLTETVSASLSASDGDAGGSGIGAGPARASSTTWDETGRERLAALEITRLLSSSLFVSLAAAGSNRERRDAPSESGDAVLDAQGVARGGWFGLGEVQGVYARELDLGVGRAGSAEAVLAPRTFRLGVRLGWR